jgi:hypothetical protein
MTHSIILPPKRWEEDSHIYDTIRHKVWYRRLLARKRHIPLLKQAEILYHAGGILMETVCSQFGVDEREFRDWYGFHVQSAEFKPLGAKEQQAVDYAYSVYCAKNANKSFRHCLSEAAYVFSLPKRPLIEQWEINPLVYPSVYKQINNA